MKKTFLIIAILFFFEPIITFAVTGNTHSTDLEQDSSQYYSIADASQTGLDITGDLSIGVWVQVEEAIASNEIRTIVSKWTGTGDQRAYRFYYHNNAGTPRLVFRISNDGAGDETLSVNQTLTTGQWYHLGVAFDASASEAEFYVDGISIGTSTGTFTALKNSSDPFYLGAVDGTDFWDGLIDDTKIWSRDVPDAEWTDQEGDPCNVSDGASLQGRWLFDNNSNDETANNNDLTGTNSPTFTTTAAYACVSVTDEESTNSQVLMIGI